MVRAWPWLVLVGFALAACGGASDRADTTPPVQFERAAAELVPHGERLSAVLGCSGCHGRDLQGEDWSEPGFGRLWTANLTRAVPHYSDAQLASIIRGGARPDRPL
jgi:mono/diheme cytochrome c family protein